MADQLKKLSLGTDLLKIDAGDYLKYDEDGMSIPFETDFVEVTKSIPNNSSQNYEMWTAPKDGWAIIHYYVEFSANATGARYSAMWNITDNMGNGASQRGSAASSGITMHSAGVRQWLNANMKMGIRIFQNSGSALNTKLQLHILYIPKVGG